jgi:nitrate/nitrite-specific signal transduction histidine kinase
MPFRIRWRSLRTRIILLSFVPTVFILSAVAYVTFYAYQNVAEDLVIQRNQELARLSAGQLATGLAEYTDLLGGVARTLGITGNDQAARHDSIDAAANRLAVFDGGVVFLDNFGVVQEAQPARPEIIGRDWSARPYFRQVFRTRSPAFSSVLADGPGGANVVVVSLPVTGPRGEFMGALAGMFRLDASAVSALYGGILKLRLGENGSIYVVDGSGRVIYHSNGSLIGSDISAQPVVQQLLAHGAGSLRTRDVDGQEIVAGFAAIPGTPWGLVSEETRAALLRPGQGYRQFLVILLILGVAVPTLFVSFAVGKIIHPIVEVTAAARQIAAGNFGLTINPATGDELEELAAQFNAMSAQLQDSYATLERRVADRTKELATLNAIAAVVSQSLDLNEILDHALAKTMETTGFEAGLAYRLDEGAPDNCPAGAPCMTMIAHRGIGEDTAEAASRREIGDGAAGDAVVALAPVVKEVAEYPDSPIKTLTVKEGVLLTVSVPLMAKNRVLGVMNLGSRSERIVTPEELSLLAGIGQQIGIAMENAHLYEKAEEVAAAAERSRLARDLHDAVTQTLFSTSLIADVLPKIWDRNPDEGRRRLEELRQLTRGALAEMRTLLLELRPAALTEASLADLLRQLGESVTGRARVAVTVQVDGECGEQSPSGGRSVFAPEGKTTDGLPVDVKVGLYRIAQEALNNVAKHSGATQAIVHLRCNPGCTSLSIEDDGLGFDLESAPTDHLGLGIMRERSEAIGALLTIDSAPDEGTRVDVVWRRDGAQQLPNSRSRSTER